MPIMSRVECDACKLRSDVRTGDRPALLSELPSGWLALTTASLPTATVCSWTCAAAFADRRA